MASRAQFEMTMFSKLCCVPRRLDEHQKQLISSKTLALYEAALGSFVDWLLENKLNPSTTGEVDCLLVQFKNARMLPNTQVYLHDSLT